MRVAVSFLLAIVAVVAVCGLLWLIEWIDGHRQIGMLLLLAAMFAYLWTSIHRKLFKRE